MSYTYKGVGAWGGMGWGGEGWVEGSASRRLTLQGYE